MDGYKVTNNPFNFEMVWHWQALDEHPPLYYALLHFICSFFHNTLTKWTGLIINIISFIVIECFIYIMTKNLTQSRLSAAFVTLLYGINPTIIQYSLMIRMYMMLGVIFIGFVHFAYKFIQKFEFKYLVGLYFVTVIGGLTNYFFYVFLVIFCICMIFLFVLSRLDIKHLFKAVSTLFIAIITNLVIFPYTLELFFQDKNSVMVAADNFSNYFISLDRLVGMLQLSPFKMFGTLFLLAFIVMSLLTFRKKSIKLKTQYVIVIVITYVTYFSLISTLAFTLHYRFVSPIDSLLFIALGYSVNLWIQHYNLNLNKSVLLLGIFVVCSLTVTGINKLQFMMYDPLIIANDNKGNNLVVFSNKGKARYEIDVIFMERDKYGFVYNTDGTAVNREESDLYWMEESIIYADSSFTIDAIENWLQNNSSLSTLIDLKTSSHGYHIFKAVR